MSSLWNSRHETRSIRACATSGSVSPNVYGLSWSPIGPPHISHTSSPDTRHADLAPVAGCVHFDITDLNRGRLADKLHFCSSGLELERDEPNDVGQGVHAVIVLRPRERAHLSRELGPPLGLLVRGNQSDLRAAGDDHRSSDLVRVSL